MILSEAAAEPGEPASKAMLQKEGGCLTQILQRVASWLSYGRTTASSPGLRLHARGQLEAQLPSPRFSCLLIAILLRKETGLGETVWSAAPHQSSPGTSPSSLHPHHVPPLLPRAPGTPQTRRPPTCLSIRPCGACHGPRPFPTAVLTFTSHWASSQALALYF